MCDTCVPCHHVVDGSILTHYKAFIYAFSFTPKTEVPNQTLSPVWTDESGLGNAITAVLARRAAATSPVAAIGTKITTGNAAGSETGTGRGTGTARETVRGRGNTDTVNGIGEVCMKPG